VRENARDDEEKDLTALGFDHTGRLSPMENACSRTDMGYVVYIVRCADGSLYTGIATDIERRLAEHNGAGPRGARYTSARRPVALAYLALFDDRSSASKEEARIKRLTRVAKGALIAENPVLTPAHDDARVAACDERPRPRAKRR
jgi:putative endonuclease